GESGAEVRARAAPADTAAALRFGLVPDYGPARRICAVARRRVKPMAAMPDGYVRKRREGRTVRPPLPNSPLTDRITTRRCGTSRSAGSRCTCRFAGSPVAARTERVARAPEKRLPSRG